MLIVTLKSEDGTLVFQQFTIENTEAVCDAFDVFMSQYKVEDISE